MLQIEIPGNETFVLETYDVLAGSYPHNENEAVLVIDSNNQLDVSTLETLGIELENEYVFEDFIGTTYK